MYVLVFYLISQYTHFQAALIFLHVGVFIFTFLYTLTHTHTLQHFGGKCGTGGEGE